MLPDVLLASNCSCPGISLVGANPLLTYATSDSLKGVELSPVDRYNMLSGPKAIEPPVWQQISLWLSISKITCSEAVSKTPSSYLNLDNLLTHLSPVGA